MFPNRTIIVCLTVFLFGGDNHSIHSSEQLQDAFESVSRHHCIECHSGADAYGALDLSTLGYDLNDTETARRWIKVFDQIAANLMPPPESSRLDLESRTRVLKILSNAIQASEADSRTVVLRRLNRREYEHTIHDIFNISVPLKELLPQDTTTVGFDTVGEGLALSAETIQAYLKTADVVVDHVFGASQRPQSIAHRANFLTERRHDGELMISSNPKLMFRRTSAGIMVFSSRYCPTNLQSFFRLRAPAGTYRGTVRVRAVQSKEPVTLRIYGGDTIVGRGEKHVVGYYDIYPNTWTTIEFSDRLFEPNGTFQFKCYGTPDIRKDADTYQGPGIEIGDITIEGPMEVWPPKSREKLLGDVDLDTANRDDAQHILANLLPRAFRRAVSQDEIRFYVAMVESELAQGRPFEEALRLALKAVLCSSEFLFLHESLEVNQTAPVRINDYALATRLSYFLWSGPPDAELLDLARTDRLHQPDVLAAQIERLLSDPRSTRFVRAFTAQWLKLTEIDFTEPDESLYPEFDELLRLSMVQETERFFHEVLEHDLSVMNFIDSDFTFLNERLAKHYGIDNVVGQAFRRVALERESVRGGVLTQASVLKVTANGTNTSPVARGVWVLENIIGKPTAPVPDGTPAVEPDIRGTITLRQQLSAHRTGNVCASCHSKIDPPGFALENFDPIGGWRQNYRTLGDGTRPREKQAAFTHSWIKYKIGLPVNAAGTTIDGTEFQDIRQFKKWLALRDNEFMTCLSEKLLIYSVGRKMQFSDRESIREIVEKTRASGSGLRSLIHHVVTSPMFFSP